MRPALALRAARRDVPIVSGFEGLLAILIVALMPVALVFISRFYALREKELMLRAEGDTRRIDQLAEARRQLEQRVETLEAIVCNAEFELDQRLDRLGALPAVAGPLSRRALPAPPLRRAPTTATSPARHASAAAEPAPAIAPVTPEPVGASRARTG
jgi:phage shock protein B